MTAEEVRSTLTGENARLLKRRRVFRRLPSPPRCKLCAAPFAGIGGLVLRHAGFARSPGNPALCTKCLGKLRKQGMSGVEMPVTLLFSDVRGSTAMGERMRPAEFHAFLDHFYRLASDAIVLTTVSSTSSSATRSSRSSSGESAGRSTRQPPSRPQSTWPSERQAQTRRRPGRFRWERRSTRARLSWEGLGRAARSRTSPRSGMSSIRPRGSQRRRVRAR